MAIAKEIPTTTIDTADTDFTVYSRTDGRKLRVKELQITNHNSSNASRVRLWDGASSDGRLKADKWIGVQETYDVGDILREVEYGDLVAQATQVDVSISGSGEEY